MKKQVFFLIALAGFLFASCGGDSSKPSVEASDATEAAASTSAEAMVYVVDTDASVINWEGYKPGQYSHYGTIKIQNGQIGVKDGAPESGNFTIDMTSLENTDLAESPEDKAKLEGHLKTGDFFEVEKFPTATFEVTGVEAGGIENATHTVSGNLTMKGISKAVNIPATVSMADGKISIVTPEFTINRTEWDIKYKSGLAGAVGDAIIADDVKLKITLVGSPNAG
jgi:polyisoprenoid-binding protein YceI